MPTMEMGKLLLGAGLVLLALGAAFLLLGRLPFLDRLPGDLSLGSGSLRLYVPLATCLVLSLVLTFVLNLLFGGRR